MQTIKSFLDQSLLIWKDSTAAARFGIILLLIICFGAVAGVGIWSIQPQWVTLADRLNPAKSSELIAALDQVNIEYQMKGAGSILQVGKHDYDRAKGLAGNLGIESVTPELESASPWLDPLQQQSIANRNLQRQLAASISRFKQVETAIVHLSIPERQPFLREKNQPTASVLLTLVPKQKFDEGHAAAIADLVANAVPGLRIEQVSISDQNGNTYSIDETLGRLTKQEEYRFNRERELAAKVESVLAPILGVGNSRVEVTTDFSFPNETISSTKVDPDEKVLEFEKIDNSQTTESRGLPSGDAGVASNIGNANQSLKDQGSKTTSENSEFKYKVSSQTREGVSQTPILNSMAVSVAVNSEVFGADANGIPAATKKSIENLVRTAVNFREGIDKVTLETLPFVDPLPVELIPTATVPWDQINNILKNISLGVAALVALFLGWKAIKNLQPAPVTGTTAGQLPGERASQVSQLSEMVKQNPEVFSKIIAAWADDGAEKPAEQDQQRAA